MCFQIESFHKAKQKEWQIQIKILLRTVGKKSVVFFSQVRGNSNSAGCMARNQVMEINTSQLFVCNLVSRKFSDLISVLCK